MLCRGIVAARPPGRTSFARVSIVIHSRLIARRRKRACTSSANPNGRSGVPSCRLVSACTSTTAGNTSLTWLTGTSNWVKAFSDLAGVLRPGFIFAMEKLTLHELHQGWEGQFGSVNGAEVVADYGDRSAEYRALREAAGILDLSFRGRICLTGEDRVRFLHGQVTNDIKGLKVGAGCYAALTTAKGKIQADLNIYSLEDELLLDFEPGLTEMLSQRLEKYLVADDVQVVDIGSVYGLLSVQGP